MDWEAGGDSGPRIYFVAFYPETTTSAGLIICVILAIEGSNFKMRPLESMQGLKPFKRITVDPNQLGGTPCIRGMRIPVATVVGMVSEGMSETEILKSYPDLELEDIREALRFAAEAIRERELPVSGT